MAKLKSILKVEGTLDELTFYKSQDGHLVRTKGGVSGNRIATDPAFIRTRENGAEFANAAGAGKLVRKTLRPLSANASDNRVVSRITQIMAQIKNMDGVSARGERNVATGITAIEAKALLKNADFNLLAPLETILQKKFTVDPTVGNISIIDLSPMNDIIFPEGATHVSFTGGFAAIDFSLGSGDLELTNTVNLPLKGTLGNVILQVPALPATASVLIGLLKLEFFQLVNGIQYSLRNGEYNSLAIVSVS